MGGPSLNTRHSVAALGEPRTYRYALDDAVATVVRRRQYFRAHVVVLGCAASVFLGWAGTMRSAIPLFGLLLLVPVSGVFLWLDGRLVDQWGSRVVRTWITCELDCAVLADLLRVTPGLPRETVEAMLASLPVSGPLAAEKRLSAATREALAAVNSVTAADRTLRLLVSVVASAVAVVAVVSAVWMRTQAPLLGLAALAVAPLVRLHIRRTGRRRIERRVSDCRRHTGFSETDFRRLRSSLE